MIRMIYVDTPNKCMLFPYGKTSRGYTNTIDSIIDYVSEEYIISVYFTDVDGMITRRDCLDHFQEEGLDVHLICVPEDTHKQIMEINREEYAKYENICWDRFDNASMTALMSQCTVEFSSSNSSASSYDDEVEKLIGAK